MRPPAWVWAGAASIALLGIALLVHTRVRGWLPEDVPQGPRKRHRRPTPLIGFLPALVTLAVLVDADRLGIVAGVGLAALTGWLDDRGKEDGDGIRWWMKALGLALAAVAASYDPWLLDGALPDGDPIELGSRVLHGALSVTTIFCLANAVNFLDNAHGVALGLGGTGLLLVSGGAVDDPATTCAAVWLSVLPFNWPRGTVFLGDSGALPLGLLLGAFIARAQPGPLDLAAAALWLAPAAVLWADFVQVVAARVVLGYRPWVADRRHLTHIALALGVRPVALAPAFALLACAAFAAISGLVDRPGS